MLTEIMASLSHLTIIDLLGVCQTCICQNLKSAWFELLP